MNIAVYENVNRSVVNITTEGAQATFPAHGMSQPKGEGSGAVLDRQGHILTNYHVIDGARQIQVTLLRRQELPGRLVGKDPITDVAVLQIDAAGRVAVPGGVRRFDAICAWGSGCSPSAIRSAWSGR